MSVEQFINELERRKLLSDRLLTKLRQSVSTSARPFTAEALADFLVQKKHLSRPQVSEVLNDLVASGFDLDETVATEDSNSEDEEAGDSSIFAPYLTGRRKKSPVEHASADANELTLPAEDSLEAAPTIKILANAPKPTQSRVTEDISTREAPQTAELKITENGLEQVREPSTQSPRITTSLSRGGKKGAKKKSSSTKDKKQWDSPIILLGGGGLALLVLCGATVWWLLNRESGDQQLQLARSAANSGAYAQSIQHYQDFLEGSPRHPQHGLARVQLAMVNIRQATEAANFTAALELAQQELEAIEDEEEFDEAHGELAALLPQIAVGLATGSEKAAVGTDEARQLAELASKAVALSSNVMYVPKSMRDEAKLAAVRETLDRVERRQRTQHDLDQSLAAMQQAIENNNTSEAYLAHAKLIAEHPELTGDAKLAEIVQQISKAEQAAIRFVSEEQASETSERPMPWVAALAVANRRGNAAAAEGSGAACVRVDGAIYGLEAATGRLLWRRHVGFTSSAWPMRVGADVLIIDGSRHELMRLDAATGQLVWRQSIGEPFAPPLVVDERAFVASQSGRLLVIDVNSGVRTGYVQFAQPLGSSPLVDRQQEHLVVAGDHSSLYTISLADMSCRSVYFLGHAEGSIRVPPVAILDKLVVVENDGVETSRLCLLSFDEDGTIDKQLAERRLDGSPVSPPLTSGRRLIVATDRGQIEVYDVGLSDSDEALAVVATRDATGSQPVARHIAAVDRNMWVGDTQLTKLSILPTGNRLRVDTIENNFIGATFDHPFERFGNTLIHVHRPRKRAGAVIAATETSGGRVLWQTDLAVPPAGPPIVDEAAQSLVTANAEGYVFRFDEAAIRSRVQDRPLKTPAMPTGLPALTSAVDLGQGRAAFCAAGSDQLLLYNPAAGGRSTQWVKLASPLACEVTRLNGSIVAPLEVGQVFLFSSADGANLAMPFQPQLKPQTTVDYRPAVIVDSRTRRFVITDGSEKIYLLAATEQPQPHLAAIATANVGPYPINSRLVVAGETVVAVGGDSHLVRYRLPTLESAGETKLSAPVVWGPYAVSGDVAVATADEHLTVVSAAGDETWRVALEHGALAGAPLTSDGSVLIAYRNGVVERRAIADGKVLATVDVEHPLAAGPVQFAERLVLTAHDGTLLVVDQP
jgi:outer membrane protein assembly factor BamB